jgi:hypothetical protein
METRSRRRAQSPVPPTREEAENAFNSLKLKLNSEKKDLSFDKINNPETLDDYFSYLEDNYTNLTRSDSPVIQTIKDYLCHQMKECRANSTSRKRGRRGGKVTKRTKPRKHRKTKRAKKK